MALLITMNLAQLRTATKDEILLDVSANNTKREIVSDLLGMDRIADSTVITCDDQGRITERVQIERDLLTGDVLESRVTTSTYYPTGEIDEIVSVVTNEAGDTVDDRVIKHYIGPQPDGHFVLTVVLAPQDVSGAVAPMPGKYWKLLDVGAAASLWAVDAPPAVLLNLHAELWAMSPAGTFGVLAVASALDNVLLPAAVRHHTAMTVPEALARRNRIADYLDALGCDTAQLRAATDEQAQMEAIVVALGYTMAQLWAVIGR